MPAPGTVAPPPPPATGRQGHYAGGASRLAAFALDVLAIWGVYVAGSGLLSLASQLIVGRPLTLSRHQLAGIIVLVVWSFAYFTYQWALSGRTVGMAIFGVRVVQADGRPVSGRQAALRTVALPLSIVVLWLGFLGILTQRERRGWHDRIAGTAVVYSWDARAARLRWLARNTMEAPPGTGAPLPRVPGSPPTGGRGGSQ